MKTPNESGGAAIAAPKLPGAIHPSFLVSALLLGLAGCGPAPQTGNATQPTARANSVLPDNVSAPAPASAKAAAPEARLVLHGQGLRLVDPAGGQGTLIAFEAPMAEAIPALTRALGRPPTKRGTNEECGAGSQDFAEWEGDIIAWFAEGRFVGWESKGDLKTADGLGLGSPKVPERHFQVEQSSLGTEFTDGNGLNGLLESKAAGAKIAALWAGSTCAFR